MKPDLTVTEFIAALRAKAKAYTERADALERDLSDFLPIAGRATPKTEKASPPSKAVSAAELKSVIKDGVTGRVSHFARHFGTSEEVIAALVKDKSNGISDSNKGWLALVESTGNEASGN